LKYLGSGVSSPHSLSAKTGKTPKPARAGNQGTGTTENAGGPPHQVAAPSVVTAGGPPFKRGHRAPALGTAPQSSQGHRTAHKEKGSRGRCREWPGRGSAVSWQHRTWPALQSALFRGTRNVAAKAGSRRNHPTERSPIKIKKPLEQRLKACLFSLIIAKIEISSQAVERNENSYETRY
jgi:hypothetical protein